MNQGAKKYLSECKRELTFTKNYDKNLYKSMVSQVENYILNNEDVSYDQLCNTYGTPSIMASHSLQLFNEKDIIKKTNIYLLHRKSFVIFILIAALLFSLGIKIYHDIQSTKIITEEITIE